jgi:hypothetical protein
VRSFGVGGGAYCRSRVRAARTLPVRSLAVEGKAHMAIHFPYTAVRLSAQLDLRSLSRVPRSARLRASAQRHTLCVFSPPVDNSVDNSGEFGILGEVPGRSWSFSPGCTSLHCEGGAACGPSPTQSRAQLRGWGDASGLGRAGSRARLIRNRDVHYTRHALSTPLGFRPNRHAVNLATLPALALRYSERLGHRHVTTARRALARRLQARRRVGGIRSVRRVRRRVLLG